MNQNKKSQRWRILLVGSFLVLIVDFGFFLAIPAQTRIFEDILCRQYYGSTDNLAEADCKVVPVQSELARIAGWKEAFDPLASILVAVPYGALADRIGRKPCLLLSILGVSLSEVWVRLACMFRVFSFWAPHADLQAGHRLSSLSGFLVCSGFWAGGTWSFRRLYA